MAKTYRYYCLDRFGQLHNAQWFGADNDEEAIAAIQAKHPDAVCELWRGKRLVATLAPTASAGRIVASNPTSSSSSGAHV